jgi:hypothetical protein
MKIEISLQEILSLVNFFPRRRRPKLWMTKQAYEDALKALLRREPEFAVFLLGPRGKSLVTHVVPDTTGEGTPSSFRVGAKRLNEVLQQHAPAGLDGKGFWHTHPPDCNRLSDGDMAFDRRLFANPKNDSHEILMPLMSSGRVLPYIVRRDRPDRALAADLILV